MYRNNSAPLPLTHGACGHPMQVQEPGMVRGGPSCNENTDFDTFSRHNESHNHAHTYFSALKRMRNVCHALGYEPLLPCWPIDMMSLQRSLMPF